MKVHPLRRRSGTVRKIRDSELRKLIDSVAKQAIEKARALGAVQYVTLVMGILCLVFFGSLETAHNRLMAIGGLLSANLQVLGILAAGVVFVACRARLFRTRPNPTVVVEVIGVEVDGDWVKLACLADDGTEWQFEGESSTSLPLRSVVRWSRLRIEFKWHLTALNQIEEFVVMRHGPGDYRRLFPAVRQALTDSCQEG